MERLLNQKEEMSVMKQVVLNLSQRRYAPDTLRAGPAASQSRSYGSSSREGVSGVSLRPTLTSARSRSPHSSRTAVHQPKHFVEAEFDDANVHKPAPTEFVRVQFVRVYNIVVI